MGFSIAEEAEKRGAKVILISGPTAQKPIIKILKFIKLRLPKKCMMKFLDITKTQTLPL
jgi:phosphopantothenoylcysteine decarboxylase/phosphopantothenate--cysteine ligase